MVKVAVVALAFPITSIPSLRHWYVNPEPLATTVKVAVAPSQTVEATGCVVMAAPD